jgi:hypothetical protein
VGIQRPTHTHTQDNFTLVHVALLQSPRKFGMMFPVTWYKTNINTCYYATGFDVVSLQNPNGTDAHCIQETVET